jgi:hypothetical protein
MRRLRGYSFTCSAQAWPTCIGWLVGISYTISAAKCSYARVPGVADSRRGADVTLHSPTSLSKEPSVPRGLALSGFYLRLCTFRL